jgi:hypothetical protein
MGSRLNKTNSTKDRFYVFFKQIINIISFDKKFYRNTHRNIHMYIRWLKKTLLVLGWKHVKCLFTQQHNVIFFTNAFSFILITLNFFVYICLTVHCAVAQLCLLEVLITLYFPKFMSRFIHIPLPSHAPPSHHLYKKSIYLLLCGVNLSSLAVEEDNNNVSLF